MSDHLNRGRSSEQNNEKITMWKNHKITSQVSFLAYFALCILSPGYPFSTLWRIFPQSVVSVNCFLDFLSFSQGCLGLFLLTVSYCSCSTASLLAFASGWPYICRNQIRHELCDLVGFLFLHWFVLLLHVAASFLLLLVSTKSFIIWKRIK